MVVSLEEDSVEVEVAVGNLKYFNFSYVFADNSIGSNWFGCFFDS